MLGGYTRIEADDWAVVIGERRLLYGGKEC